MMLKHGNWVLWATEGQSEVTSSILHCPFLPLLPWLETTALSGTRRDALPSPTPASLSPIQGLA